MDNIETWTGLPVEESIRMTEDRDKWRKYVHGVANPRIEGFEDGEGTEQNEVAGPTTHSRPTQMPRSAGRICGPSLRRFPDDFSLVAGQTQHTHRARRMRSKQDACVKFNASS